jgi:uncharacterized membrane protein YkvA (DUF1232 family)
MMYHAFHHDAATDARKSDPVTTWAWAGVGIGATLLLYAAFLAGLVLAGRRSAAQALAVFIPDCVALLRRLLTDPRISRRRKLLVAALIAYLAMPFDLVPDFIPVAGQLDDAILTALVLRAVLRGGGPDVLREHWRGHPASGELVFRLAYGRGGPTRPAEHLTAS